jgi:hypothetical protein
MIAATYEDLVMGLCTHYELVPMPAPTPTPIPHPYISMLSDPAQQAAARLTTPMMVAAGADLPPDRPLAFNGIPAARVGVIGKNVTVLPHIPLPPGTAWGPPTLGPKTPKPVCGCQDTPAAPDPPATPAGDAIVTMGAMLVNFGKGAIARLGDTAQSCSDPARVPSQVVALPKGPLVIVK